MGSDRCGWSPITAITFPYRAVDLVVGLSCRAGLRGSLFTTPGGVGLLAWAGAPSSDEMRPQRQQSQQDHDGEGNTCHDQDDFQRRHYLMVANLLSTASLGRAVVKPCLLSRCPPTAVATEYLPQPGIGMVEENDPMLPAD